MSTPARIALITGANRGIGLEVCRQLSRMSCKVILTARNQERGTRAAALLNSEGLDVSFIRLDVGDVRSIALAKDEFGRRFDHLDILVNNAGILPDNTVPGVFEDKSLLKTPGRDFEEAFEINALGAILVCQAFIPFMQKRKSGRIINVSSLVAQLSTMESGSPAYRLSKVALNAVTRILADELAIDGITVNSVSPGWVRTEMGGANAPLSIEDGAKEIVRLAYHDTSAATGMFFRSGQTIPW